MSNFKEFLINLFKQLSTGDFTINVHNDKGKVFPADVIGYSEEYQTIKVRFHSDELQKPDRKEVPVNRFRYDIGEETEMIDVMVPVKIENIYWENIKLIK